MGKYFQDNETVRVSFPDGEFIDIKEEFSQADLDYIMSKMMTATVKTKDADGKPLEKPETETQMSFGKQATLERAIASWSFVEDGKPVPITPENISNLRAKYRTPLLAKIDALQKASESFVKN